MIELAWAAGFFDGEGNVGIGKRGRHWRKIVLTIAQTEPTTLHRFAAAVGFGKVRGPYARKNPLHRPVWYWSVEGPYRCEAVMSSLWPFLSDPKREQYAQALHVWQAYKASLTYTSLEEATNAG